MQLSINKHSKFHHPLVNFVKTVTLDGVVQKRCTEVNTVTGEITRYCDPFVVKDGELQSETATGDVKIVWRNEESKLFKLLMKDYERTHA